MCFAAFGIKQGRLRLMKCNKVVIYLPATLMPAEKVERSIISVILGWYTFTDTDMDNNKTKTDSNETVEAL